MTTPDRLEQVLAELEVLEQAAKKAPPPALAEWNEYDAVVVDAAPFLRAKLRAAMEMEKALPEGDVLRLLANWFDADDGRKVRDPTFSDEYPDEVQRCLRHWADKADVALAAWRQAGEQ